MERKGREARKASDPTDFLCMTSMDKKDADGMRATMIELAVLTLMIVAFVASLLMLRNRHPGAVAGRA